MEPWPKRLEGHAKRVLARVAATFLRRPALPAPARPRRILLVRIDDRLGEALLVTPLASALRRRWPGVEVEVLVHARTARVLEGHPALHRVRVLDRRRLWLGGWAPGIRALRTDGPWDAVVDCGNWEVPAVTSALVARLVADRSPLLGPAIAPTGPLHDIPVGSLPGARSELRQRLHLLSPLGVEVGAELPSFRTPRTDGALSPFLEEVRSTPHAVLVPGGRLGWRRVPPALFAAAARALAARGREVVVAWGAGEERLAEEVVASSGARLAPATDLDGLAALLAAAGCTVCNNSGPMHLSVAVGAPTLALFLRMEADRWGYTQPPHRVIDLTPLQERQAESAAAVVAAVDAFLSGLEGRGAS